MSDFLCFIRNPVHTRSLIRLPVKEYLKLLFFYFLWAIPFGVLAAVVFDLLGMTSKVGQIAFPRQIYYGIIIAPIVEETFFRLMYIFNRRESYHSFYSLFVNGSILYGEWQHANDDSFLFISLSNRFVIILFKSCEIYFYKHFSFFFF